MTRWNRRWIVFGLVFSFALIWDPVSAAASTDTERIEGPMGRAVDSLLRRYEQDGFAGTVLVARGGEIVLLRGYGMAERVRKVPNTPDTLFEMNSMTKIFTAAAVLQLERQGKLGATDLLSKHLGPFSPEKSAATIHHLATHTAGLVKDGASLDGENDRDVFVRSVKETPIESPPGAQYRYTNAGFSLLAAVVEAASGERYEDYVRRHLFAPAGMESATFRGVVDPQHPRLARGYVPAAGGGAVEGPPRSAGWGTRGAGGIIATVGDMYRGFRALRDGRILDASGLATMFHPWPTEGYGWHVEMDESFGPLIQKGGGSPSFASHLLFYPGPDLVMIWASNDRTKRWRETLNRGITAAALCTSPAVAVLPACGAPPPSPVPIVPETSEGAGDAAGEIRLR